MAQGQNKRAGHNPFQLSLCGMKVSQMVEVFRTAQVCVCVCVCVCGQNYQRLELRSVVLIYCDNKYGMTNQICSISVF